MELEHRISVIKPVKFFVNVEFAQKNIHILNRNDTILENNSKNIETNF